MNSGKIEILLEEYKVRTDEISKEAARYHQQTQFATMYFSLITSVSGIIGILANKENFKNMVPKSLPNIDLISDIFYLALLFLAAIISYYFFISTLDALRTLYLNSIRRGIIERKINYEMKSNLLVWDQDIYPKHLFKNGIIVNRGQMIWIKPNILVAFWIFTFFIVTNTMLCFLSFIMVRKYWLYYAIFVFISVFFSLHQWFALHSTGYHTMRNEIRAKSNRKYHI